MNYSIKALAIMVLLFLFGSCNQSVMVENRDDSGVLLEKYEITKDSVKHGKFTAWYPDGTLKEESYYHEGKLHGERRLYYPDGTLEITETYNMDVMDGPYLAYHPNGSLELVVNYYNGIMEGPLKVYYADQTLKEEVTMKDNNENGPFKEFFPNGQVQWEGQYLNGDNEFGILKEYDSTGVLIRKMECDSFAVCKTIWEKE